MRVKRGDIFLVNLNPTSGREQQGARPVLVVSPEAYNRLTRTAIVLPITGGGGFAWDNGFSVSLMGTGTATTGVIRCDQIRTIDLQTRKAVHKEKVPDDVMDEVLAILTAVFES